MTHSIQLLPLMMLASLASGASLAACASADATPTPGTAQRAQATAANTDRDLCVALLQHARTCTDQYIPTLVDARAAADHPTGIKEEVAKDRAGVIAQANQEWATDSTDANIAAVCARPYLQAEEQRDAATRCQATSACGEFAACLVPIEQAAWR